jgi:hypothetical protein
MTAQQIIDNYTGGSLGLNGCDVKGLTLPQSIDGSLYLSGCDVKGLTLPQSIGGSLDLIGCDVKGLTLPQTINGPLYLSGCDLSSIPGGVMGCGDQSRNILAYNHPTKGRVVSLGCFVGTLQECIEAIKNKYSGQAQADYINKVKKAFEYER